MSVGFNVAFYKKNYKEERKRQEEKKRKNDLFSLERHHTFPSWFHDECRERHDIVCAGGEDEKWMISLYSRKEDRENEKFFMNKNRSCEVREAVRVGLLEICCF